MEDFGEYMAYYKELPLSEKQGMVIDQLKMLTTLAFNMCNAIGTPSKNLVENINNLEKNNYTDSEFAETVMVYVNAIQNSICDFDIKLKEITDNL